MSKRSMQAPRSRLSLQDNRDVTLHRFKVSLIVIVSFVILPIQLSLTHQLRIGQRLFIAN